MELLKIFTIDIAQNTQHLYLNNKLKEIPHKEMYMIKSASNLVYWTKMSIIFYVID